MIPIHTFNKLDLGKKYLRKDGKTVWLGSLIGFVRKEHLGKTLYKVDNKYEIR
jgi:hypothetical protein